MMSLVDLNFIMKNCSLPEPTNYDPTYYLRAMNIRKHQSTNNKPTNYETYEPYDLTNNEPTDYEPTSYEPTNYEPTDYDPMNYEPTSLEPTDYDPTNYKPTDYKLTDYKPTDYMILTTDATDE